MSLSLTLACVAGGFVGERARESGEAAKTSGEAIPSPIPPAEFRGFVGFALLRSRAPHRASIPVFS